MKRVTRTIVSVVVLTTISACSSHYQSPQNLKQPESLPEQWQAVDGSMLSQIDSDVADKMMLGNTQTFLQQFDNRQLEQLIAQALTNNHTLKQSFYSVQIKRQAADIASGDLWPSIDASLSQKRSSSTEPRSYSNQAEAGISIKYELDLWQKLSAAQRQANLEYLAEKANYEQAQSNLVASVTNAWLNTIEAENLVALSKQRVEVAKQSLDIIETGYEQGLNEALDVYLSRNDYNSELSRLSQQKSTLAASRRNLERLIGDYPAGRIAVEEKLPELSVNANIVIPSQLIENKPELQASWYALMAKNAALAFAHKQRYPSLQITATAGDSGSNIEDLFSGSGIAWSLLGNLTAPIFNAGQLKAREQSAELALKQAEQSYLATLFDTFEDVENRLTNTLSLQQQYQSTLNAESNARLAAELSFEQYQSGLVSYTTVLNAQTRAFEAQSQAIQLHKQVITNQIELQLALGAPLADLSSLSNSIQTSNSSESPAVAGSVEE